MNIEMLLNFAKPMIKNVITNVEYDDGEKSILIEMADTGTILISINDEEMYKKAKEALEKLRK